MGGRLYVCVDEWFVYVASVIDAFSRRIVGWRVGTSMSTALVQDAVGHAFFTRAQEGTISLHGLIAHNDAGSQGGFNRSSQHRVVNLSVVGRQALPPVFSTRSVLRGRLLSASATASTSRPSYRARSVPFGKYCRSTPLVFSFVPRCHGL